MIKKDILITLLTTPITKFPPAESPTKIIFSAVDPIQKIINNNDNHVRV